MLRITGARNEPASPPVVSITSFGPISYRSSDSIVGGARSLRLIDTSLLLEIKFPQNDDVLLGFTLIRVGTLANSRVLESKLLPGKAGLPVFDIGNTSPFEGKMPHIDIKATLGVCVGKESFLIILDDRNPNQYLSHGRVSFELHNDILTGIRISNIGPAESQFIHSRYLEDLETKHE